MEDEHISAPQMTGVAVSPPDNQTMKNLRPETLSIIKRVETLSGCPVEFKPDSSLTLRATLQMARNAAPAHVFKYRPTNDPIDYWVAYQAGFAIRLFDLPPNERFDFVGTGQGIEHVETLIKTGQPLNEVDLAKLNEFSKLATHWALMNLRSFAIGLRIDQWIHDEYPSLREMQAAGMGEIQQENLALLSQRLGNLSIPVPLLSPVAACAVFADRLLKRSTFAIPYRAAGMLDAGKELVAISDSISTNRSHDRELVDAWGNAIGMNGWYRWAPFKL